MDDREFDKNAEAQCLFALREPSVVPELHKPQEYFQIAKFENSVRVDAVRPQNFVFLTFEALGFKVVGHKYPFQKKRSGVIGRLGVISPPQLVHDGKDPQNTFAKHRLSRTTVLAFKSRSTVGVYGKGLRSDGSVEYRRWR